MKMHQEIDVNPGFRRKVFAMTIKGEIVENIACVMRLVPGSGNSSGPRWAREGRATTKELNRVSPQ
jgi:hypothetical protein